jgi:alpha-beta hydrolase superfamily lysophospholipase
MSAHDSRVDIGEIARMWERRPVRAAVVAFSGIGGHSGDFVAWGEALSERGIALAAVDYPGFGTRREEPLTSPSDPSIVDRAIVRARATWPDVPVASLGESLGALVVLSHAASGANAPDGLVLSSPAIRTPGKIRNPRRLALRYIVGSSRPIDFTGAPALLTGDSLELADISRDPLRRRGLPASYLVSVWRLQRKSMELARRVRVPTLILWGDGDRIASFPAARGLLAAIPQRLRRLEVVESERHMLTRGEHRRETAQLIGRWVEQLAAPVASPSSGKS